MNNEEKYKMVKIPIELLELPSVWRALFSFELSPDANQGLINDAFDELRKLDELANEPINDGVEKIIDAIRDAWKVNPNIRFGQLICNAAKIIEMDPFYINDYSMIECLKKMSTQP